MALYRAQMTEHALAQIAAAEGVLGDHLRDGVGCCTTCGRPAPCPARVDAEALQCRWFEWLAQPPEPALTVEPGPPDRPVRPRPAGRPG